MPEKVPITIIGGGVVGCAIAYELSRSLDKEIFLIEMNQKVIGDNQSSRNSGVIHAGIYYHKEDEPLKAKLCVEGNSMLYDFCSEHEIPHKKSGKLVVATNENEEECLDDVLRTALDNDVPEVRKISGEEVRAMEPNVSATSAIYVPTSGIIEPMSLVKRLHKLAKDNGVYFVYGNKVINAAPKGNGFEVTTETGNTKETFETEVLINAAGLYSDDIARMVNKDSQYQIEPIKGESAKFYRTNRADISMNGMNVYPAPYGVSPNGDRLDLPFKQYQKLLKEGKISMSLGVHLTPILDNEDKMASAVMIGPTFTEGVGKEDYTPFRKDVKHYLERISSFFPNLRLEDIELNQVGIRAKLKDHNDFVIERDIKSPNCINLVGMDSPGLTSSLAIAKYVRGFF